jgi:hypothetical protein
MCFDNITKFYASHHDYISQAIDINPFIVVQAYLKLHEYSYFKRKEKNLNV